MLFQLKERELAEQDLQGKLLFPNLSSLQIGFNELDRLPDEIGELKSLKTLSLKKNSQLKEVRHNSSPDKYQSVHMGKSFQDYS